MPGVRKEKLPRKPTRRRWLRRLATVFGVFFLLGTLALTVSALWAFTILPRSLPSVTALETLQPLQGSKVYDDNDELFIEFQVERRIFAPLPQIPKSLRDAVLAV